MVRFCEDVHGEILNFNLIKIINVSVYNFQTLNKLQKDFRQEKLKALESEIEIVNFKDTEIKFYKRAINISSIIEVVSSFTSFLFWRAIPLTVFNKTNSIICNEGQYIP